MNRLGLIQVYTGNGKGKTTAALGLALRAIGQGLKVWMVQFMKGDESYGEIRAAKLLPGFTILQVGRNDFVNLNSPDPSDVTLAQKGWEIAKNCISSGKYDIVILDEINVAMACGLLDTEQVIEFLTAKPRSVEIILTGRYASEAVQNIAQLVTEMREIRHPYHQGVPSRIGIEY
ncbi:MAG: cob(I)yrinic acid a,c-diamide adenosyltransferase [Negativicutes bacterium]